MKIKEILKIFNKLEMEIREGGDTWKDDYIEILRNKKFIS